MPELHQFRREHHCIIPHRFQDDLSRRVHESVFRRRGIGNEIAEEVGTLIYIWPDGAAIAAGEMDVGPDHKYAGLTMAVLKITETLTYAEL
jgi:hypothetical protein